MTRSTRFFFPLILLCFLLCFSASGFGQLWSGILAPLRATDWTNAGVPGGIPTNRTQCGSTIAAYSGSAATINSALAACGAGHYVQLGAGTFNLSNGVDFTTHSNVSLKGMGADQTLLVFSGTAGCMGFVSGVCMASSDLNYSITQSNLANWTAGYLPGSTAITLSSKSNLQVGSTLILDQTDDATDSGDIFVCYQPKGVCSTNGDNGGFDRSNRSQQQMVTVTSIIGIGPYVVGIFPGLYMPNWTSGKSPQAWWASNPIANAGVEDLSLNLTAAEPNVGNGFGIEIFNCNGCWVKGVRVIQPGRSHVQIQLGYHVTVQDSYFFRTAGQTSTSYGVETAGAGDTLIQNNIFQQITEPISLSGNCSGCVLAYNFDINNIYDSGGGVYTWRMAGVLPHASGIGHLLIEGNQGSGLQADIIHGSHHFITAFRNTWSGYQKNNGHNPTGNTTPVIVNALNRFVNVIGNVLGSPTLPTTNYQSGTHAVYEIGSGDQNPDDPNVLRTLMRWGNYDVVTGTRWCGNSLNPGWGSTCGNVSEVPSLIANFANPVPAFTTLPPSFFLTGKPAWWPASKAWPPIGPDVSGGDIAGYAGHAYSIPAADCYALVMSGPADGTGGVLSFNSDQCYGAGVVLNPPTGLAATAH